MSGATSVDAATGYLRQWPRQLAGHPAFQDGLRRLLTERTASLDSVWGSSCALTMAALAGSAGTPEELGFPSVLMVCPGEREADELRDDLETFTGGAIEIFPAFETNRAAGDVADVNLGLRMRLLKRLLARQAGQWIAASIQALLQPVPHPAELVDQTRRIEVGSSGGLGEFQPWLDRHGFTRTPAVEWAGEYSIRGGILDLFAWDWEDPVRIEWFGEVVESIRSFDVATQRSLASLREIDLTYAAPGSRSLFDYSDPGALVVLLDLEQIEQQARQFTARQESASGLLAFADLQRQWAEFAVATVNELAAGEWDHTWRLPFTPVESIGGDPSEIKSHLDRMLEKDELTVVVPVAGEIQRLKEILESTAAMRDGRLRFDVGNLNRGFRWVAGHRVVMGSDQLFRRGHVRRVSRAQLGRPIDSFSDLRDGDLVVHLAHGIGRYRGLRLIDKAGLLTEHLEIEFHGGTRLYVPATKIDLIQKYVGGTRSRPTLARIGGKSWVKQKQATEAAISDLAAEMLELQASRTLRGGITFGPDTLWQHELEQSFPYRETPDQLAAIEAVKRDMQRSQPMDRLLCGDVGFGKTEVAIRAAFKAVENGYQVAVLVPTTILAEQHYRTFSERMAEFPLHIAKLSRFVAPQEARDALARLKTGGVDIVIGTHRLLSSDVEFNNLGLTIVDEEQRFGVGHKERLKLLRANVDILTLSATPIPRTLHMALVGVRDISNLETPPEDRLAVETRVVRFRPDLIRQAILREINRGGQVYYIHNRIQDIELVRSQLQEIVPEASIAVGHAQMPDERLDQVMTDFIAGRFDVLLATTIVESGLDIPNANTIIIDEADRYGLADLHQLRGRVGRYKNRAYCYLVLQPLRRVHPTAAKRLQAIETFSEMGAGFAIAMRDLEIRGAGNLLGTEQSGHIAAVGYELYCQMLEAAVRQLKHLPQKLSVHVDIDLPGIAYLPDDYVTDRRQKIDLYRRLTRVEQFDEIQQLRAEFIDRFGHPPAPVEQLLRLAEIRLEAAVWQIETIFLQLPYLGFRYRDSRRIRQLADRLQGKLRVVDDQSAFVTLKPIDLPPDRLLAVIKAILNPP